MRIRRFDPADAAAVSALIQRTLRVSNAKDYPPALLDEVIAGELENEHDALMKRAREIYTLVSSIYI